MRTFLATGLISGLLLTSVSAAALDRPKAPSAPTQKGEDVREKPDGFIPDTPREPDTGSPNVDKPGPDRDPKKKPDGWVPDTPKIPD
jgi:hypothetical protein